MISTISSIEYEFTTTPGDPVPLEVLYKNNMSTTAAAISPMARQIDNLFDEELAEEEEGSSEVSVNANEMAFVALRHEPIHEGTISAFTTTFQATSSVVVLIVPLFGLYWAVNII